MLKLLIVDDDEWIREGIRRNVNWSDSGIEVVGTAADGQEGWELVRSLSPDLLLTDIRMPFMDGLELARLVQESLPRTKVIFLTGYDDFAYAKQAIQLKASDYVMKFEDNDRILQAVLAAGQELIRERDEQEKARKSQALIRGKFFADLIGVGGTTDWVRRESALLGIRFAGDKFAVAVIQSEDVKRFSRPYAMLNPELLLFSILNICEELFPSDDRHDLFFVSYNQRINVIYSFPDGLSEAETTARIEEVAGLIRDTVAKVLKVPIRVGVGGVRESIGLLPDSYNEALAAVQLKDAAESSGISFSQDVRHSQGSHQNMLNRILEVIHSRYGDEKLTLTTVAGLIHLTPTYVSTLFKKYQNVNFVDYLIRVRMEKAEELLIHSDRKAYEIAESVGYPNSQYFSVAFKKHTGCSPLEYRQKHQK
ncbi:response regulator [Cohnella cholangitidis]|uniref:Response regulator n=1 Tax=Cohnella cholangitidis TaxID=2598458 RepID=A0A7G5C4F8_9BACL|nr:response regulator [Cohnella cholangitidis]QMV44092.1 response regulator [Cohnella cholangitidis]